VPHLPYSIELHDSRLAEIPREGVALILRLSPAYIHRDGKGWRQEAELVVAGGASSAIPVELPIGISDGALNTAQGPYHNLLMLPLDNGGPVVLQLELVSGALVRVTGEAIRARLSGEPEFVEDVA